MTPAPFSAAAAADSIVVTVSGMRVSFIGHISEAVSKSYSRAGLSTSTSWRVASSSTQSSRVSSRSVSSVINRPWGGANWSPRASAPVTPRPAPAQRSIIRIVGCAHLRQLVAADSFTQHRPVSSMRMSATNAGWSVPIPAECCRYDRPPHPPEGLRDVRRAPAGLALSTNWMCHPSGAIRSATVSKCVGRMPRSSSMPKRRPRTPPACGVSSSASVTPGCVTATPRAFFSPSDAIE